jgi:hypothetical protein
MESLRSIIRVLQVMLTPKITRQEDKEIRAEIELLEIEYKALQARDYELKNGVSLYGSYFAN